MYRLIVVLLCLLCIASTTLAKRDHDGERGRGRGRNSHHRFFRANRSKGRGESPIIYKDPNDDHISLLRTFRHFDIPHLPCPLSDNECIAAALKNVVELYPKGYPLIKLPSIEPFYLRKFDMIDERNKTEGYRIKLTTSNLLLHGFANSTFSVAGFEEDINSSNVTITMITPKIVVNADYNLRLKFNRRSTRGKGKFVWTFTDFIFKIKFQPKIFLNDTDETDNKHYLALHNFDVDYVVTDANLDFGDLLDEDDSKYGSKDLHKFLNENIQEYFNKLKSSAGPEWTSVFLHFINPIIDYNSVDNVLILDNLKLDDFSEVDLD